MKKDFYDFDEEARKSKSKKPKRGQKAFFSNDGCGEDEYFDEN